eukprot:1697245-Rhodomonas_salina.1
MSYALAVQRLVLIERILSYDLQNGYVMSSTDSGFSIGYAMYGTENGYPYTVRGTEAWSILAFSQSIVLHDIQVSHSLSAYAPSTRCPVPSQRISPPARLHDQCAQSGTETAYGATCTWASE